MLIKKEAVVPRELAHAMCLSIRTVLPSDHYINVTSTEVTLMRWTEEFSRERLHTEQFTEKDLQEPADHGWHCCYTCTRKALSNLFLDNSDSKTSNK